MRLMPLLTFDRPYDLLAAFEAATAPYADTIRKPFAPAV
jgi:hypothetical protein